MNEWMEIDRLNQIDEERDSLREPPSHSYEEKLSLFERSIGKKKTTFSKRLIAYLKKIVA